MKRWILVVGYILLFTAIDLVAQVPPGQQAARLAAKEAGRYVITVADDRPAELKETPVLIWSNPIDTVHGVVYCWLADDRPAALASIYKYFAGDRKLSAEFLSLYPGPLRATRDKVAVWDTKVPGVEFKVLDGIVPAVARSAQRLQMRQIARRFSAQIHDWGNDEVRRLRLLPKALLNYGDATFQGGLYAFVVGTDPDLILMIETATIDGKQVWQYALARLSINKTIVQLDDQPVWQVEEHQRPFERMNEPYTIFDALKDDANP